jgi:hypothetical protein
MFCCMSLLRLLRLAPLLLTACAVEDSHIAHEAQTKLIGMTEVDLESCLGVPDQHSTFGTTEVLTYYATSTSADSWAVPLIGGFSVSNGAYCHATFQLRNGHVTQILYSGEKNATLAPDAYCAPIMRTCLAHLQQTTPVASSPAGPPPAGTPAFAPQAEAPSAATSPGAATSAATSPVGAPSAGTPAAAAPSAGAQAAKTSAVGAPPAAGVATRSAPGQSNRQKPAAP